MSEYKYTCYCEQCGWEEVVKRSDEEKAKEIAEQVRDAHWMPTGHTDIYYCGPSEDEQKFDVEKYL